MKTYTKGLLKSLVNMNIVRTPKGMCYRKAQEDNWEYSDIELWSYINREGGIQS